MQLTLADGTEAGVHVPLTLDITVQDCVPEDVLLCRNDCDIVVEMVGYGVRDDVGEAVDDNVDV